MMPCHALTLHLIRGSGMGAGRRIAADTTVALRCLWA